METFSHGTLDPWFVTGFANGEASFTFSRSSRQIALYFALKLAATEREILESIQLFFGGIGKLYDVGTRSLMFRVTRHNQLRRVVRHFDAYPLMGHKAELFSVWREMVVLKSDFRGATREAVEMLALDLSSRVARNHAR